MPDEIPMTKKGMEVVQAELDKLIKEDREEIKVAIQEARELGDLKENAEYHAAKEKQSQIEGRIMQLQGIVAQAKVIDVAAMENDKIVFGATVTLFDPEKDESMTIQIVGDPEADRDQGRISIKSPLGRALIGKEEGDTIIVKAPKGDLEYEIESFEYI